MSNNVICIYIVGLYYYNNSICSCLVLLGMSCIGYMSSMYSNIPISLSINNLYFMGITIQSLIISLFIIYILYCSIQMFYSMYIEVLYENRSKYINITFSNNNMLTIIVASELIIIFFLAICFNNITAYYAYCFNGIIMGDNNYNIQYINLIISFINNTVLYLWYNNNTSIISMYILLVLIFIFIWFIQLQLKEYINFSSYMNESIIMSYFFMLICIHSSHISNCIVLLHFQYNMLNTKLVNSISTIFIFQIFLYDYVLLIYNHLVTLLWYYISWCH